LGRRGIRVDKKEANLVVFGRKAVVIVAFGEFAIIGVLFVWVAGFWVAKLDEVDPHKDVFGFVFCHLEEGVFWGGGDGLKAAICIDPGRDWFSTFFDAFFICPTQLHTGAHGAFFKDGQ
jgi:hypothetical protein